MRILYIFTLVALVLFSACDSPKEKAMAEIKAMEGQDSLFSPEHIEKLKKSYLEFAEKYPDDELAPEFMFKAAQRCNVMAQHLEAIELFNRIMEKYPNHHISEEALFLQGYIYENSLHDEAQATRVYTDFIKKYPKSELTEDAQLALQNMGKTPEEIFESFKEKDTVQTP
ncbi:MAG: tetratricopeptide repeat protein [Bacteroidia bacterium]|jgi:outer membrane protein assembly factor BamD (BamD/ComL family)